MRYREWLPWVDTWGGRVAGLGSQRGLRINRVATKHDCQYSTIGEVKDWIAAYEKRLARRAARAARGGVDSETDESDEGL